VEVGYQFMLNRSILARRKNEQTIKNAQKAHEEQEDKQRSASRTRPSTAFVSPSERLEQETLDFKHGTRTLHEGFHCPRARL
jgi:hypothetical protein